MNIYGLHKASIHFLPPDGYLVVVESTRTANQQIVEHHPCHCAHQSDHCNVLCPVGEGCATDGVPFLAITHWLATWQAAEVKVSLVIVAGAEVCPPLQHLWEAESA